MDKFQAYKELTKINKRGVNVTDIIVRLSTSNEVPQDVLDFIKEQNKSDFDLFIDKLNKLKKDKNNKIIKNILNYTELSEVEKLKCLSSYVTTLAIEIEQRPDMNIAKFKTDSKFITVVNGLYQYAITGSVDSLDQVFGQLLTIVNMNLI